MSRREDLYLADIVLAHYRIASYLQNLTFADFGEDDLRQDGVIRQLSIIGEAASSLAPETRDAQPEIPYAATKSVPELADRVLATLAQRDPAEADRVRVHKPAWLD